MGVTKAINIYLLCLSRRIESLAQGAKKTPTWAQGSESDNVLNFYKFGKEKNPNELFLNTTDDIEQFILDYWLIY